MMGKILIFFFSLLINYVHLDSEQLAFNFFLNQLLSRYYPEVEKINFSGKTIGEKRLNGPFLKCEFGEDFNYFYKEFNAKQSNEIEISYEGFSIINESKKISKKHLNLLVYRFVEFKDHDYVYIKVYKVDHFVDHYLIKISKKNKEVQGYCRFSEII